VRSESDRRARRGGRRGERSVASEPGRRENGDRRADSGMWNRKDGGSGRRDVAVSTVAGGSDTGSDPGPEEASGSRCAAITQTGEAE
jgi:hypothetical protein